MIEMVEREYGDINPKSHKDLLAEINNIVKTQHIKRATRSEPALANSEFHLVKRDRAEGNKTLKKSRTKVSINNVANIVTKNTKQKKIASQLKVAFKNEKTLPKPLERVHSERIQRTVAYEKNVKKLNRWDAVVTQNQYANQLVFPLESSKLESKTKAINVVPEFRYTTVMMKKLLEARAPMKKKVEETDNMEKSKDILTLEEMKERRKEMARIKAKESFKIAKSRLQGKIKSKKYHKLKKREILKQKMKNFEDLKITNPEAALKELEKIEFHRVQERANLRHKNTGTWAKNLQVRSKYDNNVRQDLEAQLAIGRELTQKNKTEDSSDSEGEDEVGQNIQSENPWLNSSGTKEDDIDELFSGYKKFWLEHNQNEKEMKSVKNGNKSNDIPEMPECDSIEDDNENDFEEEEIDKSISENEENMSAYDNNEDPSKFINDLFDEAEEKIETNIEKKLKSLKPKLLNDVTNKKKQLKRLEETRNKSKLSSKLEFNKKARLRDVDEALNEGNEVSDENAGEFKSLVKNSRLQEEVMKLMEKKKHLLKSVESEQKTIEINPDSFLSIKSKHLLTALPKMGEYDDLDDDNAVENVNQMSLEEAFEDDDIVNDFEQVQIAEDTIEKTESLILPGWGSWGGHGVVKRNKKQVVVPKVIARKEKIIVSNDPNPKLSKHLLSSVPFPFKTIEDFEASLRAPIGRDFIPETAYRKMVLPAVVTKAGAIIEPMTEDDLLNADKKKNRIIPKKTGEKKNKTKFMKVKQIMKPIKKNKVVKTGYAKNQIRAITKKEDSTKKIK